MKLYKIRHIPTGLYYIPSKGRNGNLSITGKIYTRKPRLQTDIRIILRHTKGKKGKYPMLIKYLDLKPDKLGYYNFDKYIKTNPSEWIVEQIKP